jgi:hypothetical protein
MSLFRKVGNSSGTPTVTEGDSFVTRFTRLASERDTTTDQVERLVRARRSLDRLNGRRMGEHEYAMYRRQLAGDPLLLSRQIAMLDDGREVEPGLYRSFARGLQTLERRKDGSYLRKLQDARTQEFDAQGMPRREIDRNGNVLEFDVIGERVVRASNGVAWVLIKYDDKDQRIVSLRDSAERAWVFQYGAHGYLASIEGPGVKYGFDYDGPGNMTRLKRGAEETVLTYNTIQEVSTITRPGRISESFRRRFIDPEERHSVTEVQRRRDDALVSTATHEFQLRRSEVVTSFNAQGKVIGRQTKTLDPRTGYVVSILDEEGKGRLFEFDPRSGEQISITELLGQRSRKHTFNQDCGSLATLIESEGGKEIWNARFTWDDRCGVIGATLQEDERTTRDIVIKRNAIGKPISVVDQVSGDTLTFQYGVLAKPISITLEDVGILSMTYHPTGEIDKVMATPCGEGVGEMGNATREEEEAKILSIMKERLDELLSVFRRAAIDPGF